MFGGLKGKSDVQKNFRFSKSFKLKSKKKNTIGKGGGVIACMTETANGW